MRKQLLYFRFVALGCILLQSVAARSLDECYKYHKRASVKSVCGRIQNIIGERPDGVVLTLVTPNGNLLSTAKVDSNGKFVFGPVPKGNYLLRGTAPGYMTVERDLQVTHDQDRACKPKIEVTLGISSCHGGIYVKGFDKKRDLFR
ncbi:MAG TPA: carboxypeptidase-like regulatory domain-containing protein [Candidatus Angelobacter sp.]|nr:carboxypeptidase-like regulatory domain-containing protein [Candidatus Angelobacter sp.]